MDLVKTDASKETAIHLMKDQIELANIKFEKAKKEEIGYENILTGKLVGNENTTVVISSRMDGRIEKLFFKETGMFVNKGQPLYQIYSESLAAFAREYILAVKQQQEIDSERYRNLVGAAAKKLSLLGLTASQISDQAKASSTSPYFTILAPASGTISKIEITEGQSVTEGSAMMRLENFSTLWAEAELPQNDLSFQVGQKVKVILENESVETTIRFIKPELQSNGQIAIVRAEISNEGKHLQLGMQANFSITQSAHHAVVVPLESVIRDEAGSYVWIVAGDGSFHPQKVKTGIETADKIEITWGLVESEQIVISGAYLLHSERELRHGSVANNHDHEKM
jgi:Cu(I)/Ag(I) efflux system membrane fusion protein